MNEKNRLNYYNTSGRNVFVWFFWKNCSQQKDISKLTDLLEVISYYVYLLFGQQFSMIDGFP